MYRTGHYGAALLAYAPVGGVLLAAGFPGAALVCGAVALAVAPLPDYDQRVPLISHRGVTHTVGFALLVAAVLSGVGFAVGSGTGLAVGSEAGTGGQTGLAGATAAGAVGVLVGALAVGSHLLADALTPAGIAPFWPLSSKN
ncbi:MAG: metal-dependent hydrolase [Halosimplex sp.]